MKVLLDTSTLIAAMLSDHIHHGHALPWLAKAKTGAYDFVCSGHSLAEIYAVLTRLRRLPVIAPDEALQMIQENVTSCAQIAALTGNDYTSLIESLVQNKVAGGAVYDAVIARVAELANVDFLVTLNLGDFHRVWPTGATRIVSPQTQPPP